MNFLQLRSTESLIKDAENIAIEGIAYDSPFHYFIEANSTCCESSMYQDWMSVLIGKLQTLQKRSISTSDSNDAKAK